MELIELAGKALLGEPGEAEASIARLRSARPAAVDRLVE
jgi:hypothetical protein